MGMKQARKASYLLTGRKLWGRKLAGKCAPVNLSRDGKTLHVRAASSTIKQELTFRKEEMIRNINKLPSCKSVLKLLIQ